VQARVNKSRPLWFIFSTASTSIIDLGTAKQLGLPVEGNIKPSSTGGGAEMRLIHGISLELPGVTTLNQRVATLPLNFLSSILGQPIAGIIGYDFVRQFVVDLNYGTRKINVYAAPTFRYSGSGEVLPLKFIEQAPFVGVKITMEGQDTVAGTFELETADTGVLQVERSFTEAHQLVKSAKGFRLGNAGGSEEGLTRTLQGRVRNITLGRYEINNPIVSFLQADAGKDAQANGDGQLGGEVLRRFRLILDYTRQRIIIEPNQHLTEAVEADMSGIELVAEGEDLRALTINEVVPNSPASEAGLKEEDEVTIINGQRVSDLSLEQIRQSLKQEGQEVALTFKRGTQTLQAKLRLRRLI